MRHSFGKLPRADNGETGLIHSAASGGEEERARARARAAMRAMRDAQCAGGKNCEK